MTWYLEDLISLSFFLSCFSLDLRACSYLEFLRCSLSAATRSLSFYILFLSSMDCSYVLGTMGLYMHDLFDYFFHSMPHLLRPTVFGFFVVEPREMPSNLVSSVYSLSWFEVSLAVI